MAAKSPVDTALAALKVRSGQYQWYSNYVSGHHSLTFATERFRNVFGRLVQAFADNLCEGVISALVDRLEVEGFEEEGGKTDATALAWQIWQANRLDIRSAEVHQDAATYGDGYVIVWEGDDGNPEIFPNDPTCTTVHYSAERRGLIDWAAKWWPQDDGRIRLNLYYPNRIEKYVTRSESKDGSLPDSGSSFAPAAIEGEPNPLPNPYGVVPVFHFANNARTGQFGRSELADVIPLQDALNKSVADMIVAMEYVAFPQRWASGIEVQVGEDGKPIVPFTPGVERIWAVGAADAKFGEFPQADMSKFLGVSDSFRLEIARITRTPLHYLLPMTGGWPSGESLKTAEGPFLAKVKGKHLRWGNTWEDALAFAVRIANGPAAQLSALWKDTSPRSDLQHVSVEQIKAQLGVSEDQVLRELGYSEDQITTMKREKAAAAPVPLAAGAGSGVIPPPRPRIGPMDIEEAVA